MSQPLIHCSFVIFIYVFNYFKQKDQLNELIYVRSLIHVIVADYCLPFRILTDKTIKENGMLIMSLRKTVSAGTRIPVFYQEHTGRSMGQKQMKKRVHT